MSNQPDGTGSATATAPQAAPISPELLQRVIDEAAHFNLLSIPDCSQRPSIIYSTTGAVIGMEVCESLHRFQIKVQPPSPHKPLTASNLVGEKVGSFRHRWMLTPDDWAAVPDRNPPQTALDPSRSQRFVMLDSECRFGNSGDGFRGFGTGQTIPSSSPGRPTQITAVGTILEGFGKFQGHEQGTYVYCGVLTPESQFTGNILLRVEDPRQTLHTDNDLPGIEQVANPEPDITYIVFRGQAIPSDPVSPRIGPDGKPNGLVVVQGLRLLDLDCKSRGPGGVTSTAGIGPTIGKITASVTFDPAAPGGSNLDPIPFLADDEFFFYDSAGKPNAGTLHANSTEGRVFKTLISGQPGIRFGGTGLILSGSGPFNGIAGLMTDNSVVAFTPHVSASVYVLRISDPQGRFRSGGKQGGRGSIA
jgi:hypothetical protein